MNAVYSYKGGDSSSLYFGVYSKEDSNSVEWERPKENSHCSSASVHSSWGPGSVNSFVSSNTSGAEDKDEDEEETPDLICQECEQQKAKLYCTACLEALCTHCSSLLHLPHANGEPHDHLTQNHLRRPHRGDCGALALPDKEPAKLLPSWEVDEAEAVSIWGKDLTIPSALEAPRINAVANRGKMEALPKFKNGDRVLFFCDQVDFEEDSLEAFKTGWRDKEAFGEVLGGPIPRHGQWGSPFRRGEQNENYYRVRLLGFASSDYHEAFLYEESQQQAVFEGVQIVGQMASAPMAKERQKGLAIDRKIKQAKDAKVGGSYELGKVFLSKDGCSPNGNEPSKNPKIMLLAESSLKNLVGAQEQLRKKRQQKLGDLLKGCDERCSLHLMLQALIAWHIAAQRLQALDFNKAAVVLQKYIRSYIAKGKLKQLQELEVEKQYMRWKAFHSPFRYVKDPKKQRLGYTVDGIHFFATRAELGRWCKIWMHLVTFSRELMERAYLQSLDNAFRRLKYVGHDEEINPDEEDEDKPAFDDDDNASENTKTFERHTKHKPPWHPALGMSLPELPTMWAKRGVDGSIIVDVPSKFNSFRASMAGPTDTSNWLIPDLLLMGAFPGGLARNVGKRLVHTLPDSISQILFSNVGVFVCLMEESELREAEKESGFDRPFKEVFELRYEKCRAYLQQSLLSAQTELFKAQQEVKHAPQYELHDLRYKEANINFRKLKASERLCLQTVERLRRSLVRFPLNPIFEHFPIPIDQAASAKLLLPFLQKLEYLLREEKQKMYIFSYFGHGRAGLLAACLLGRLYGFTHEAALERLQICHDSRVLLANEPSKISCPQSLVQVAVVREILRETDVLYSDLTKITGFPNADERREVIRKKERFRGVPEESNTIEILQVVPEKDSHWYGDSTPETNMNQEDTKRNTVKCAVCANTGVYHRDRSSSDESIQSDLNNAEDSSYTRTNENPIIMVSVSAPSIRTLRAQNSLAEYRKPIAKKLQPKSRFQKCSKS